MDHSDNKLKGNNPAGSQDQRDAQWRELLACAEPRQELLDSVLPWQRVLSLVEAAPPVKPHWSDLLFSRVSRQTRFALAAVALAVGSAAGLAVMPAQSDQIGTVVLARVPMAWEAGGAELAEVEAAAEASFSKLPHSEQADMYFLPLKSSDGDAHPTLAIAFLNVDSAQAEQVFEGLAQRFPGLSTGVAEYHDIQSQVFENRLQELLSGLREPGRYRGLGEAQIRSEVLRQLHSAGLAPESISIERTADGGLKIEVSATMDINVAGGHLQEALGDIGLSPELLGSEAYEQLMELQPAQ
ncbi:hypothetical protein IT575_02755 [bacterium]|nr:hypothetical protein [bacterium]